MATKLRVGVVGLGGIASDHHLPNWLTSPHCKVVALCETDPDRLAKAASRCAGSRCYSSWRDLIGDPDIDVVDICTPNALHAPIAVAALQAGKHVLCEKPMATSSADANEMLRVARERGLKLQINHHFRFQRKFRELLPFATEATLGTPYFAHARWHRRRRVPVAPTFLNRALSAGGPLLDLGVHVIDLAMLLMGFPKPVAASASVGTYLGRSPGLCGDWGDWNSADFDVEDFACVLFRFENGATMFVETTWLGFHDKPEEWFVKVLGTGAGLHWPDGLVIRETSRTPTDLHLATAAEESKEPYRRSIHDFADAIVYDRPEPIPPEQSLVVVRMVEAAYASARAAREIPIPNLPAMTVPLSGRTRSQ